MSQAPDRRDPPPEPSVEGRLDSWKEIAAYLRRGPRTVQRWEREHGLPVHRLRLPGQRQGSVFAYQSELDAWWGTHRTALEQEAPATPAAPPIPRKTLWVAALAGAAFLAGLLGLRLLSMGSKPGAPLRTVPLTSYAGLESYPAFSPDGRRIAFFSDRTGSTEIWLCDQDGSHELQLTSFWGPVVTSPNWSPDGRQIAFDVAFQETSEIYTIGVNGGQPRRLTTDPANDRLPSWSRDGRWIYFASDRTREQQVWKIPAAGGQAVQVTRGGGYGAYESIDGKFLYYAKTYSYSKTGLWRVPVEGGEETAIGDWLVSPYNFTVAGDGVYFIGPKEPQGGFPIGVWRPSTRRVERLGTIGGLVAPGLTVWPTDRPRWMLYAVRERSAGDLMMVEHFR